MKLKQLGKNGPEITEVGLGAWAIGGPWMYGWGAQDDEQSIQTIQKAISNGVNWIDTAAVYGLGHGETVVGEAVADRRKDLFIATKCGLVWDENGRVDRNSHPKSIRKECDASLKRLQTDVIDLYQIHWHDSSVPVEDSWGEMTRLVEEGKVRFIGVSNFDIPLMERCLQVAPVQSLQPPFSMIKRDVAAEILPWCEANGVGVIAYSPLQNGLLTGKFSQDYLNTLADDDWRKKHKNPYFREPIFSKAIKFVDALKPISKKYDSTAAALAIRWVLANTAITAAIVGARTIEQANRLRDVANWEIETNDLEEIEALYKHFFGDVEWKKTH